MLNYVNVIGRLKAKPELKSTKETGKSVCSFTLAVQRDVNRQSGERDVDWINCVAWGSTAEQITKWFDKGDPIVITGRLTTRDWEDIHKQTRTSTEVIVDRWYYAIRPRDKAPAEPDGSSPSRPRSNRQARFHEVDDNDELPF